MPRGAAGAWRKGQRVRPAVLMVRLDVGLSLRSSGSTEVALVEGADMRALVTAVAGIFGPLPKDGTGSTGLDFCLPTPEFLPKVERMDYSGIITVEAGKRGGKPCIRGLRITVYDVLENLACGMTHDQLLQEFPYLTEEDIRACLAFAADRERKLETITE